MNRDQRNREGRTILVLLVLVTMYATRNALAQDASYSASDDYRSILTELSRDTIRPSHLGTGQLLKQPLGPVPVDVNETDAVLRLETPLWRLDMQKETGQILIANKESGAEWKLGSAGGDSPGIQWEGKNEPSSPNMTLALRKFLQFHREGNRWIIQAEVANAPQPASLEIGVLTPKIIRLSLAPPPIESHSRLMLTFHLVAGGPFYGLGERFVKAQLDGQKTTLRTSDRFGQPGHNWTYAPVPFLFSPRGLGVYFDTTWPSTFDLTEAQDKQVMVQLAAPATDCYLIIDSGPKGLLESYTGLTGRTPVPPPWAFGTWINIVKGLHDLGAFYRDDALDEARRLRERHIPVSALWTEDLLEPSVNIGWPLWTVGYYGQLRPFAEAVHQLGYKVLVYTNPWVSTLLAPYLLPNPTYQEGERNGYFVHDAEGHVVSPVALAGISSGNTDLTNPAAVDWWARMKQKILTEYDFDGWMEDFGEQVRDTDHFAVPKTGEELANLYPLLYHKVTHYVSVKAKPNVVEFSRSGYAGSQGYTPVLWGGDQFPNWSSDLGLPSVVPAGISAGLSGFAIWGPDIQSAGKSKELWIRWLEFGALTPIMRDHKWDHPQFAVDLWYDNETTEIFRRYARMHISLFPYFYTYADEAAKTGLPIIRHLMLEYPDDSKVWGLDNEYLLGERILVAPVLADGSRTRSLYLPKGSWMNYWTGQILEGEHQVEVSAPLDQIPIFYRAGSLIPLISPDTETLARDLAGDKYKTLDNSLTWRIIPSTGPSQDEFTLYDGTRASVRRDGSSTELRGDGLRRQYEVIVHAEVPPKAVRLSGQNLPELTDADYQVHKTGWQLKLEIKELHVFFSADTFTLQVSPNGAK